MHTASLKGWTHDHSFEQDKAMPGERRILAVILITTVMMVIEIAAGLSKNY